MSQKKYWSGLDELNETAVYQKNASNEFKEDLPFDLSGNLLDAQTPRRDFLKYLGFSTAAAMLAASCEMPVRKVIPYAIKPEDITPGVPNFYASTFVDNGDYCAIVIKTRDGRPIKIEGNEKSSITKGGTSARVQASVLNLYDKARLRQPYAEGHESTFEAIDRAVMQALASNTKPAFLVTGSLLSPTTKEVISQFTAKFPTVKHIVFDAVSYSGMLQANEACYGKRTLPSYHFDKAQTIVSLGADFLGTWLSPVEFAKQYSAGRKVSASNMKMSKHYQVESNHTTTGAKADERAVCRPSEMGTVAVALYNAITTGEAPKLGNDKLNAVVANAAADLKKGNGLVVCGTNDVNIQTVVNAINNAVGANGITINWAVTSNYRQGIDADMVNMVTAMNAGEVGAVFFHGVNPVYEYYQGSKVLDGLKKVPLTVSFAERMDETAKECKYVVPDHHYLESWGDAEPKSGYFSLMQPGIAPIFKTRAFQDNLMAWSGNTATYAQYWNQYWLGKMGSQAAFDIALQEGIIEPSGEMAMGGATFSGNVANAIAGIKKPITEGKEIFVYEKIAIGRGAGYSNNPWLLEMPDPMTKATWDNYALVSPKTAADLGAELTSINEVDAKKHVIKLTVNGVSMELPIVVMPGMHNDVVGVALGYGRCKEVGRAADNTGKNAYPFITYNGTTFENYAAVTVEKTDAVYAVAITQTHLSYEGRPILHEFTAEEFAKDPKVLLKEREAEIGHYAAVPWAEKEHGKEEAALTADGKDAMEEGFRENGTLYPNYESHGIHWGMSIDLNTCVGCGNCVMACQAENNVSVVGKTEVLKSQEMHWIRIDRYFSGMPEDPNSITTVFQPMMCQHCDNAPCENVCPVAATPHTNEGLNMMTYNRCIGTKYCANNCAYKVRRFNWLDWNGADCFDDNLYEDYRRDDINDDLTRMVLNPDVTVRSRGVMEKCTFCVQRLQYAKLEAKKANRPLMDGEAKTACQQSCPSDAIQFGNVNDKSSNIFKLRNQEQMERKFYVLEQLHTLPNINYLALIRNSESIVGGDAAKDGLMNEHI